MTVFALGLNHTTAPITLREQVSFAGDQLSRALSELRTHLSTEVTVLSTCNRTEIYFANPLHDIGNVHSQAAHWLAAHARIPETDLKPHLYFLQGTAPIRHAFRVACGLDSMVLGEPQILGQLKQAVKAAQQANTLGTQLHHVFQQSFAVAKEVRTHTGVGAASVSMAAAAVRLAQRIFGDLNQCKILMIGAGEMIDLCATYFIGHTPAQLDIANRSVERGQALVNQLRKHMRAVNYLSLAQIPDTLGDYDIVISCTASTLPIIGYGMTRSALNQRQGQRRHAPMMMIDLAVPRDIESEIAELSNVYLYTVDDLGKVVQEGRDARAAAVVNAEKIIDLRIDDYQRWLAKRRAVPVIQNLKNAAHTIRDAELQKAIHALNAGTPAQDILEQLSYQLTQKLLHGSLSLTQTLAQHKDADTHLQALEHSFLPRKHSANAPPR